MNYDAIIAALRTEKKGLAYGILCDTFDDKGKSCENPAHCAVGALLFAGGMQNKDIIEAQELFSGDLRLAFREDWYYDDEYYVNAVRTHLLDLLSDKYDIKDWNQVDFIIKLNDSFETESTEMAAIRLERLSHVIRELEATRDSIEEYGDII